MKTPDEVKLEFRKKGISIADWSRKNGFTPELVYQVLGAKHIPFRGLSHQIAVKLGIKDGIIEDALKFDENGSSLPSDSQ